MISKLKKLKGRTLAELTDRGRQTIARLAERAGASGDLKMPTDKAFSGLFGKNALSPFEVIEWFRGREPVFYPVFTESEAAVAAFRSHFPDDTERIVNQSEAIVAGTFDLLGYRGLDFGAPIPDWHFEPVSGKKSPLVHWSRIDETDPTETGDKRTIWELNRHQYFTLLGRAYWLTGDEKYTDVFLSHLEDWIEKNPPKIGVNWMSSLEIAYRSISWIWGFYFFRDSPRFRADVLLKVLKSLYLNARHLERHLSTYASPNTHLTGEALGLYVLGTFLNEIKEADRWKETGYAILMKALEYQIREDGGYVEQCTQYHRYTADIYLSLFILRKAEGLPIDERHRRKLTEMLEFLMHATQPDGQMPMIGDDDGGRLHFLDGRGFADFRSTLAVGAALLDNGRLKCVAGKPSAELLWLTGTDGMADFERLGSVAPEEKAKGFEQSGFYVIRDGFEPDAAYILIDCGEHGFMNGGHAHADALSFVMSVKGSPVFIDSGTYLYTLDKESRDYFRSSSAHNSLTVDGRSSSVPDGPFSWKTAAVSKVLEWRSDETEAFFRGSHDGFECLGVKYERVFRYKPRKQVTIVDNIRTMSRKEFGISFILAPDIEAEILNEARVVLRTKDGKRDLLTIVTKVIEENARGVAGWRIGPARISPRYGSLVDTTKLLFKLSRERDFEIENSFIFSDPV